jgi:hypothetical protein
MNSRAPKYITLCSQKILYWIVSVVSYVVLALCPLRCSLCTIIYRKIRFLKMRAEFLSFPMITR